MKERPILFSAPMVRALLNGNKTQTRRIVKRLEVRDGMPEPEWASLLKCCPYGQPGDRLWVRETFNRTNPGGNDGHYFFRATEANEFPDAIWKPSIHMPRWASRITLEVTGVRVDRLQDISESDAVAEGCAKNHNGYYWGAPHPVSGLKQMASAVGAYRDLWESINGPGSWDLNPWVWCVSFKVVKP
jgi:hypothetical protein